MNIPTFEKHFTSSFKFKLRRISVPLALLCVCFAGDHLIAKESLALPKNATDAAELIRKMTDLGKLLDKHQFKNVIVDFSFIEQRKLADEDAFKKIYWATGKLYLAGRPNSLIKMEFTPRTSIWEKGAAPYLEENYSFSFNGKYWITLQKDCGPIGSMAPVKIAEITETCPPAWKFPRWDTGECFFISHAEFYNHRTLSETLKLYLAAPKPLLEKVVSPFKIKKEGNILEISMEEFSTQGPQGIVTMWLDISKSGALKKYRAEHLSAPDKGWYVYETTVEAYSNIKGMWLPTRAKRTFQNIERKTEFDYIAKTITLAEDNENLYNVRLEPGTHVTDRRTDNSFTVGRSIEETARTIESGL